MALVSSLEFVHKNRGLTVDGVALIRLTRVDLGTIHLKRSTKVGPVDNHLVDIPKDECVSRLQNWRKLLKCSGNYKEQPGPESKPRQVNLVRDGNELVMALVWVNSDDEQEWDSQPVAWTGEGWVPFWMKVRDN